MRKHIHALYRSDGLDTASRFGGSLIGAGSKLGMGKKVRFVIEINCDAIAIIWR